jgi:pimeloyl-ACP methyl ester carboxylesterase
MLDFVDLLLLRRGIPADDKTLTFRRIDGNPRSKVVYFLPWHTPFGFARHAGFAPLDFLACYEMPPGIVSSEPDLCVQAMLGLVADAERLLPTGQDAVIVGLSVGTYPATYLANRIGARLCSVASADRADLAIWQSPATRLIKRRAVQQGYQLSDYTKALFGSHPAENLAGIAPNSLFVVGQRDPYVPQGRKAGLLQAISTHVPSAEVVELDAGHFKTLAASGRYQRAMLGLRPTRRRWKVRLPFNLSTTSTAMVRATSTDTSAPSA